MAIIVHQLIWDETVLLLFALHLLRDNRNRKLLEFATPLQKTLDHLLRRAYRLNKVNFSTDYWCDVCCILFQNLSKLHQRACTTIR